LLVDFNLPGGDPAERIAAAIVPHLTEQRTTLFMLFDAMIPNIASILDGLYLSLADRVRYVGVNAGSETFQPMPCLFDQDRSCSRMACCGCCCPAIADQLSNMAIKRPSRC
jgi:coenzyme F420-reducing hydrogenase gamma subunit